MITPEDIATRAMRDGGDEITRALAQLYAMPLPDLTVWMANNTPALNRMRNIEAQIAALHERAFAGELP